MRRIEEIQTPLRFVVTVDTEADDAWSRPDTVEVTNVRQLDRFQDLCDEYGVVPTYLLAYECTTRDEALAILKPIAEKRRCEVGHHLHVWTTPPFQNEGSNGVDLDWIHAFQFQLPDSLFEEKAEALRQAIERSFGRSPTSHRAGRWGVDQRTVDWLTGSGFVAETSMRTGLRLLQFRRDIESSDLPNRDIASCEYELCRNPYIWPSAAEAGGQSIIELPATVDVPSNLVSRLYLRYLSLKWPGESLLFRIYRRLSGLAMLYPDPALPPGRLPKMIDRVIRRGTTVINLSLHSSELALGCSPLTQTQADLDKVWLHLEEAFRYCRDRELVSQGISDVAHLARQCAD
jgi:hypothetical protein